jgi:3-methyl-2-oxobutanoate hydroxymethyltransferase
MGHVGLTPQSYHKLGGFKVQGRETHSAREILDDAAALAAAGCFAIVLECVPDTLAAEVTRAVPVPTIGIGAGPACDGQVLVFHDAMGLTRDLRPRFVRRYTDLSSAISEAARSFVGDVKSGAFPTAEESFSAEKTALRRVY